MNVFSTFSGVGGLDLGLERAGHTIVAHAESVPFRREVLAARFGAAPIWHDVRAVCVEPAPRGPGDDGGPSAGAASGPDAGSLPTDLLAGGFPCQDLSIAGRRAGLEGDQSGLFHEFVRIAEALRPEWLLLENVPGLFSSHHGRDLRVVFDTLADLGFLDGAWRVLDSRFLGVAQRRRRVFIVARRGRGDRARAVLLEPESLHRDSPPSAPPKEEVAGTLGGGSGRRGWCDDLDRSGAFLPVHTSALTSRLGSAGADDNQAQAGHLLAFNAMQDPCPIEDESPAIVRGAPHGQGSVAIAVPEVSHALTSQMKRNDPNGETYVVNPNEIVVRRLTPTECERLQGFPDGWTCLCENGPCTSIEPGCTLGRRYAALGDAVTVNVGEWLGRRLAARA